MGVVAASSVVTVLIATTRHPKKGLRIGQGREIAFFPGLPRESTALKPRQNPGNQKYSQLPFAPWLHRAAAGNPTAGWLEGSGAGGGEGTVKSFCHFKSLLFGEPPRSRKPN